MKQDPRLSPEAIVHLRQIASPCRLAVLKNFLGPIAIDSWRWKKLRNSRSDRLFPKQTALAISLITDQIFSQKISF